MKSNRGLGAPENYSALRIITVVPDVIILGKGMGGGMPVGAFVASEAHMDLLSDNPNWDISPLLAVTLSLRQQVWRL
jgi:glutamate-1-semialdehyde aminotransferase